MVPIASGLLLLLDPLSASANETTDFFARLKPQMQAIGDCYDLEAVKLATNTCEGAETVVEAAFGGCRSQESAFGAAVSRNGHKLFDEYIDGWIAGAKTRLRASLLNAVLSVRADRGLCKNSN